jgi:uncharacterized SAM-dependent methyltransferase
LRLPGFIWRTGEHIGTAFNLNLLRRINRELHGDIPVPVRWNERLSRIEMHLRARQDVQLRVADCTFAMKEGEIIHSSVPEVLQMHSCIRFDATAEPLTNHTR